MTPKEKFVEDIIKVYQKHNMSISHEDHYGGFEIERYTDYNADWLRASDDQTDKVV